MRKLVAPVIILIITLFAGCYYDNEESLYPEISTVCDTSNVTFNVTLVPLLNNYCWSCHSDANASFGRGIHLQKYADVKSNSAIIIPAIDGTGPIAMPPNGKLGKCSIAQFKIWVSKGMPEN